MKNRVLVFCLLITCSVIHGQGNSPFSQFGPGDFFQSNFQTNFSRAGAGTSSISGNRINLANPASFSQFTITTGETGIFSSTNFIKSNNSETYFNYSNLSGFGLGFPVAKKMGVAFGLTPLSKQNYAYSFSSTLPDNTGVDYQYEGDGSLNKVFLGYGLERKNLSVGVTGLYVFGRLNDITKSIYEDQSNRNIRFQEYNNVSGFGFNFGLQYKRDLGTDKYLNFGGFYELGNSYNTSNYTTANYFIISDFQNLNNKTVTSEFHETDLIVDTRENPTSGNITLPSTLQGGLSMGKMESWETSLEYRFNGLSNYELNGLSDGLNNSNKIILSSRIIPNKKALGKENYWKTISYNFGIHAGNAGIVAQNEELNEIGINFGFGLPLKKFKYQTETFGSSIFLSVGYLNRSNSNLGINENFLNINASVVLNDKWFIKRKFQ